VLRRETAPSGPAVRPRSPASLGRRCRSAGALRRRDRRLRNVGLGAAIAVDASSAPAGTSSVVEAAAAVLAALIVEASPAMSPATAATISGEATTNDIRNSRRYSDSATPPASATTRHVVHRVLDMSPSLQQFVLG
jgi:hypothetical protein